MRPLGLAARMSADQHAEYNIEINEISAAMAPVPDGRTCPVRYVLATGASLTVSAKVGSSHSKILRHDYRAIADAISGLTAVLHPADT